MLLPTVASRTSDDTDASTSEKCSGDRIESPCSETLQPNGEHIETSHDSRANRGHPTRPDPTATLAGNQPSSYHSSTSSSHPASGAPNIPSDVINATMDQVAELARNSPSQVAAPSPSPSPAPDTPPASLPKLPSSLSLVYHSAAPDAPSVAPPPAPTTPLLAADQVAAAAAVWHQHAAAGADDESLLGLARALGLVAHDARGSLSLHPQLLASCPASPPPAPAWAAGSLGLCSSTQGPRSPSVDLPGATRLDHARVLASQLQAASEQLLHPAPSTSAAALPPPSAFLHHHLQAQQQQVQQQQQEAQQQLQAAAQQQQVSALAAAGLAALLASGMSLTQCAALGLGMASPGGSAGGAGGGGGGRHSHGAHPGLGPAKQHALYKTEMCKGWMENGTCRYGHKCQFAHGAEELRLVPRHPKYKTEVCRSFTLTGSCVYGGRCRFLHAHTSAPNALYGSEGLRLMGTSGDQGAGFGLEEVQVEGNWDTLVSAAQRARMASNLFKQPAVNALSPASGDSLNLHPGLVSHLLRHSVDLGQPSSQHASHASPAHPQPPLDAFSFSPMGHQQQQQQQQQASCGSTSATKLAGPGPVGGQQQHPTATSLLSHLDLLASLGTSPSLAALQLLRNSTLDPTSPASTSATQPHLEHPVQQQQQQQQQQQAAAPRRSARTSLDSRTTYMSMESSGQWPRTTLDLSPPLPPTTSGSSPFSWIHPSPQALLSARSSFESGYSATAHLACMQQQQQQPMGHNWVPMQQWAVGDRVQRWAEAAAGQMAGMEPLGPDAEHSSGPGSGGRCDTAGLGAAGQGEGRRSRLSLEALGHEGMHGQGRNGGRAAAPEEEEDGGEGDDNPRLNYQLTMTQLQSGQAPAGERAGGVGKAVGQGTGAVCSQLQAQQQQEQQQQQQQAHHHYQQLQLEQQQQQADRADLVRRLSASMVQQQPLFGADMQMLMSQQQQQQQQQAASQFAGLSGAPGSTAFPGFASMAPGEWAQPRQAMQPRRLSWQPQWAGAGGQQPQAMEDLQLLLAALHTPGVADESRALGHGAGSQAMQAAAPRRRSPATCLDTALLWAQLGQRANPQA